MEKPDEKPLSGDTDATAAFRPDEPATELVRILDGYLDDLQAGRSPSKEQLLAANPQLAGQLEACLAGMEFIHRAAVPADAPPQLGDFRIIRELGRGGMGVVYEADQVSLGRRVALKVLRFGGASDPEAMQRFEHEAQTVAKLHHTNIVPIFAVGCERGVHYYAMQYIEGRSLADVVRHGMIFDLRLPIADSGTEIAKPAPAPIETRQSKITNPRPSAADVARWGLESAEALDHAHARGVIHRDVKPSNLLLDMEGRVWLTDFGLARRADEVTLTVTGALLGTPRYMSPEQATAVKHPIDHRTDLYSLGATLYELATGRPVFEADTPHGVITQILNTEPVPPRRVRSDIPRDLETVILKCLAKEPGRRYATARDLAEDLRSCTLGRAIQARRPSVVERAARWAAKNRRTAGIAAASVAASIAVMVGVVLGTTAYRESKLGRLALATNDTKLVAEVLHADRDEPVMPKITLPTQQPVALPEGEYRIRLTEPGQLSDTYRVVVNAGHEQKTHLSLMGRQFAEPIPVEAPFFTFDTPLGSDVFLPSPTGLRRFLGRSMTEADPIKFDVDEHNRLKDGLIWYGPNLMGWSYPDYRWNVSRPAPDLDGDGHADLVLSCPYQSVVLALSGKTGKRLWLAIELPEAKADPMNSDGAIRGVPAWTDCDGDGTVDAIVTRVCAADPAKSGDAPLPPRRWVESLSGRTGKSLWRRPLDNERFAVATGEEVPYAARWFVDAGRSNSHQVAPARTSIFTAGWHERTDAWFPASYAAQVVESRGQQQVWLAVGKRLTQLDVSTGYEVGTGHELGFWPIRAPQFADLDGDGQAEALALEAPEHEAVRAHAVALSTGNRLWKADFKARTAQDYISPAPTPQWPVLADVDGDLRLEMIVPTGGYLDLDDGEAPGEMSRRWAGLEVFDGATGKRRWERQLIASHPEAAWGMQQVDNFLAGPDIDGDGKRDVFAVSTNASEPAARANSSWHYSFWLYFDALSGDDGRKLWTYAWELSSEQWIEPGHFGQLQWGLVGSDGLPTLMMPYSPRYAPSVPDSLVLLETSTGRLAHRGEGLKNPQVADLDGDGLMDLCALEAADRSNDMRGKLRTIRGMGPDSWRFLGELTPAADFDGDGTPDFVSKYDRFTAISGRTGQPLWRLAGDVDRYQNDRWFPPLPGGDLDGDGTPDILAYREARSFSQSRVEYQQPFSLLQAISGKSGELLWSCGELANVSGFATTVVGDLDRDGAPEVIVMAATDWDVDYEPGTLYGGEDWRLWLAVISGRDGTTKWMQPLSATNTFGMKWPEKGSGLEPATVDLNGDGVLDIVAAAIVSENGCELRAFDGKTGTLLWKQAFADRASRDHLLKEFPMPIVGDLDGDGKPEVVVLDTVVDPDKKTNENQVLGHDTLVCLDGASGQVRWRWRGEYESLPYGQEYAAWKRLYKPTPLLVNLHGDGRRAVCVWSSRAKTVALVGHDGQLIHERKINMGRLQGETHFRVWCADLDDDGKDELVLRTDGKVMATTGGLDQEKWSWDIGDFGEVIHVARPRKDGPWNVVIDKSWVLQGLDGATGKPRWGCDFPNRHSRRAYDPQPILPGSSPDSPPLVVFKDQDTVTVGRQALALAEDGKFRPAAIAPASAPTPFADPRRLRALPWVMSGVWNDPNMRGFLRGVVGATFLIVWVCRPTRRHLAWMVGRALIFSAVWAGILLMSDIPRMLPGQQYSWFGAQLVILQGMWLEVMWQGVWAVWTFGRWLIDAILHRREP